MRHWLSERAFLRRTPFLVVCIAVGMFVLLFAFMQFRLYDAFRMGLRDLGFFLQSSDSLLRGELLIVRQGYTANTSVSQLFYSGWEERTLFSEHVYLFHLIALPLYAWTHTPYSLFVLNALGIGLAAIPLYLLARRHLKHEWMATVISLAYLMLPSTQIATLGDYVYGPHPDSFAPFFLFAALYFADLKRPRAFWLMSLLALSLVESLALTTGAIGLYLVMTERDWRRHGAILLGVSAVVFVAATQFIIPLAGGGRSPYYFAALKTWGVALAHPEMLAPLGAATFDLAVALLLPLALLPILGGKTWLIAVPTFFSGLAAQTVGYTIPMERGSWHIWAYVIAACLATIHACAFLQRRFGTAVARGALWLLPPAWIVGALLFGPYPFSRDVWPPAYDVDPDKLALIRAAQAQIPYDASLSVEFFVGSHFANRPNVYWFPVNWRQTQYVLVDEEAWAWWSTDDTKNLTHIQHSGNTELIWQRDKVSLFQRKDLPEIQNPLSILFANGMELVGYNLESITRPPGATLDLILFWKTHEPITVNLTVFNHLVEATGKLVAQKDNQPDNGTYPTSEWTTEEVIPDRYHIKIPETASKGAYDLQVGLYDPQNGQRVLTSGGEQFIILTTVSVNR